MSREILMIPEGFYLQGSFLTWQLILSNRRKAVISLISKAINDIMSRNQKYQNMASLSNDFRVEAVRAALCWTLKDAGAKA